MTHVRPNPTGSGLCDTPGTRHDTPSRRPMIRAIVSAAMLLALPPLAWADGWPTRAVTIVSPYNPGGTNDIVARLIADRLQKALGHPFVVENKAGAAGIVGATLVMNAAPDGYRLLSANNGALVVQSVVKTTSPYDPRTAFTPIFKLADAPNYVGISADVPAKTVGEFIAHAKRQPGKLNYSSAGVGSFGNFMGEYFKQLTGTDIVHVPDRGSAAALNEMMAGRIQLMIDPQVLRQRDSDRIRVLATTQSTRVAAFPEIPTVTEFGGPEMSITGWFGLVGPAGLPAEVVEKIGAVLRGLESDAEAIKMLTNAGLVWSPVAGTAFSQLITEDMKRYREVQQRAGIVAQ